MKEESLPTGWNRECFIEKITLALGFGRTGLICQLEKESANCSLWAKSVPAVCFDT